MKRGTATAAIVLTLAIPAAIMLSGCRGILSEVYDEPESRSSASGAGQLYVDASDWREWHYIDLPTLAEAADRNPDLDTSGLWTTLPVPDPAEAAAPIDPTEEQTGLYTYWYDVFGAGISNREYLGFAASEEQPEPEEWTIAIHRNNMRTNGCGVCETPYTSIDALPKDRGWMDELAFQEDEWNQTDVWVDDDRMLLGIVGSQGICINRVLSGWLEMKIPPMPPSFELNSHVYLLRLKDGTFAALQLADYMDGKGVKCCMTINYRYPL